MSWQTYVDEHLMCEIEGHHLTSAAIIGHDGTVWAQSTAFPQVSAPLLVRSFLIRSRSCVGAPPIGSVAYGTADTRFRSARA